MAKHKLFKLGAATALTVTGVSAITSLKTVRAANFTAIKRVKISYLPGKSLNIWTSYNNGKFMGYRAKDGTVWNVAETAVDSKGNLWYKVGTREWIEARYTVDVDEDGQINTLSKSKSKKKSSIVNLANKVKKSTKKDTKTATSTSSATKTTTTSKKTSTNKAAEVKKVQQIVNAAVKKTQTTSSVQASSRAGAIVSLAKQQIGKPYVWGANGPDSFDCSSLVQYVYQKAAGVNLPRTTYDQIKVGQTVYAKSQSNNQPVSANDLQVGDLLFWGSETAPYHVAIYIGNNQYVNAATPEQGTILQTLTSYYSPTIVKRVL